MTDRHVIYLGYFERNDSIPTYADLVLNQKTNMAIPRSRMDLSIENATQLAIEASGDPKCFDSWCVEIGNGMLTMPHINSVEALDFVKLLVADTGCDVVDGNFRFLTDSEY